MDQEPQAKTEGEPTLTLFLGLYLIMLSFFILLNTLAKPQEDRVKAVFSSLLGTFSVEILNTANPTALSPSIGEELTIEELHGDVREYLELSIPLVRVEFFSAGEVMRVALPASQLFEPASPKIRTDREEFVQRISHALGRWSEGLRYELEVTAFTGPDLAPAAVGGRLLEVERAGALARALLDRGAPSRSVVIGARAGHAGEVELTFFARIDRRSKVDFAPAAP